MNKFSLDYEHLDQRVNARTAYRLADVEHRIEKVAFDVVRFVDDDDSTRLWQIQDTPDGPVIVAMYEQDGGSAEPSVSVELKSESTEWKAVPDKQAGVHIFHKGEAIVRLAAADFGIPESEVGTLCRWLPKKLATDDELRSMVLKMAMPPEGAGILGGAPMEGDEPEASEPGGLMMLRKLVPGGGTGDPGAAIADLEKMIGSRGLGFVAVALQIPGMADAIIEWARENKGLRTYNLPDLPTSEEIRERIEGK